MAIIVFFTRRAIFVFGFVLVIACTVYDYWCKRPENQTIFSESDIYEPDRTENHLMPRMGYFIFQAVICVSFP